MNLAGSYLNNRNSNKRMGGEDALMQQIPEYGRQGYQPFINRGMQAQDQASNAYQQMLANPNAFLEQLQSGYQPSQGYQYRRQNAMGAARNSAAQGGFSGTGYDQMQQGAMADGLLSQDMQQYLQNVLGIQNTGLQGQQHIGDMGYNASGNLADYLGNTAGNRAFLRSGQNRQRGLNDAGMMESFNQFAGQGLKGLGQMGADRDAATQAGMKPPRIYNQGNDGSWLTTVFGGFK